MTLLRMEHVGIVVDDLGAPTAFLVTLGLEVLGEVPVEGSWVDRVNGLEGTRADIAMRRRRTATDGSSWRSSTRRRALAAS